MSTQGRQSGSFGDEMTNILIAALIGAFGLTLVLRAAGSVATFLTGAQQPSEGIAGGIGVLFDPTDPGRALGADESNPFVYWLVAGRMAPLAPGVTQAWRRPAAAPGHRDRTRGASHRIVACPIAPSGHTSPIARGAGGR